MALFKWEDFDYKGWFGSAILGWFMIMVCSFPACITFWLANERVIHSDTEDIIFFVIWGVGALVWITMIIRTVTQDREDGNMWLGVPLCVWYPFAFVGGVIIGGGGLFIAGQIVWSIIKIIVMICQWLLGFQVMKFY
jgi:hypothetical protein